METKPNHKDKRGDKAKIWKRPGLPPEPRNPDELDFDGRPPHHPGAASAPGEGPNPTPPETGR